MLKAFATLTGIERQAFTQKAIKRYSRLADMLGGEENFTLLARSIIHESFSVSPVSVWDTIDGYEKVLGALFSFMPLSDQAFASLTEAGNHYEKIKDQNDEIYPVLNDSAAAGIIGKKMRNGQICKGLSVAEIGGSVSCRIMEVLGADITFSDAGYQKNRKPFTLWQKASDFISNRNNLVTLDHYSHKLGNIYDFTVSNRVLDPGSGAEAIAEGAANFPAKAAAMELLAIYSNITKFGGYSIHGGLTVQVTDNFFDYIGFDMVKKMGKGKKSLTILTKRECKPNLYANGIKIGFKTIFYDKNTNTFSLKK